MPARAILSGAAGRLGWLAALLLALTMLVTSLASSAAEYDPALLPEVRMVAANLAASLATGEPEQVTSPSQASDLSCSLCCQGSSLRAPAEKGARGSSKRAPHGLAGGHRLSRADAATTAMLSACQPRTTHRFGAQQ